MNDELLHRRGTREVIDDHLRLRQHGELEEASDAITTQTWVLLSVESVHQGHQGVRELADVLAGLVRLPLRLPLPPGSDRGTVRHAAMDRSRGKRFTALAGEQEITAKVLG
jgi:hypothetical protein